MYLCQWSASLRVIKVCPDVQREPPGFELVSITSGLRKEPGSVLSAHSLQGFIQIDEVPLSLLQPESCQLSQTLIYIGERVSSSSVIFVSLCCTFSSCCTLCNLASRKHMKKICYEFALQILM